MCFCPKIGVKWYCCCCCFVHDFMTNWCCCCEFMLWVFIVMKIVVKFELFLRVLWKMAEFVFCVEMMFLIQDSYGFECLFTSINVWTNFGNQFGHWGSKFGILGQKWGFSRELSCWLLSQLVSQARGEPEASNACHNSPCRLTHAASCTLAVLPVSRSCVFFVRFCFDLTFGVNLKVVENWVNFPHALVWLENDF